MPTNLATEIADLLYRAGPEGMTRWQIEVDTGERAQSVAAALLELGEKRTAVYLVGVKRMGRVKLCRVVVHAEHIDHRPYQKIVNNKRRMKAELDELKRRQNELKRYVRSRNYIDWDAIGKSAQALYLYGSNTTWPKICKAIGQQIEEQRIAYTRTPQETSHANVQE